MLSHRRLHWHHLWLLGLGLRLVFAVVSLHQFYPDETYQTLEAAHRLAFGYGLIPWDYQYHLRSYLPPLILSLPLHVLAWFKLDDPAIYTRVTSLFLATLSSLIIPAGYYTTKALTHRSNQALLVAYLFAIWYELIYFSTRALTESLSLIFISLATIISLRLPQKNYLFGLILGLAAFLRIQYAPLIGLYYLYRFNSLKATKVLIPQLLGLLTALGAFGLIDYFTYGQFLTHLFSNLKFSFISGISRQFGTHVLWSYLLWFTLTSGGLFLFSLPWFKQFPKNYRPLLLAWIVIIAIHSLITHKEYRFLMLLIPIWIILASTTLLKHLKTISVGLIFTIISLLGFTHHLPLQNQIYSHPLTFKDPILVFQLELYRDPNLCSLNIPERDWVYAGSYYYLHRQLPIYSHRYPPPENQPASHLIMTNNQEPPPNYVFISKTKAYTLYTPSGKMTHPGYALYRLNLPCQSSDSSYSYHRSFDYLKPYLP